MGPLLLLFVALQLFYTLTWSKVVNAPQYALNTISDNDYSKFLPPELSGDNDGKDDITDILPVVTTDEDTTEMKFHQPLESVNIDYDRNAIVAKFSKGVETKQKTLQDDFIRFNKRSYEEFPFGYSLEGDKYPRMRLERSQQTTRDPRGDNFMRFGRSGNTKNDFIRFGRGGNDFMRFGRAGDNFMRFGRSAGQDFMRFGRAAANGQDFMRFGRTPSQDFMRFGRTPNQDFMRFGRSPSSKDFMRFGRAPSQDFMRFGRTAPSPSQDFMRFGRAPSQDFMRFGRTAPSPSQDFMRFGRNPHQDFMRFGRSSTTDNFMRFGRAPPQPHDNFMRFGKSLEKSNAKNSSEPIMGKNELKQAVKLIHEADENSDNENPVDKAIKALYDKQQHDDNDKDHSEELENGETSMQTNNDSNDLETDMDYLLKISN